jgi:hypothetical protein
MSDLFLYAYPQRRISMKRRDFLFSGAISTLLATRLHATPALVAPLRTGRLVDPSAGNVNCQDTVFDGKNLICLYSNQGQDPFAFNPDDPTFVAATTTAGSLVWSYPLPKGMYVSLGTHQGSVAITGLNYFPSSGNRVQRPILLLDPANGNITEVGPYSNGMAGPFSYAGDSRFFRIFSGTGEVWDLNNGLVQSHAGIVAPTFAKKFTQASLIAPDTIAVVDSVGTSMALVSLTSGSATESSISSEAIASSQAISGAAMARAGVDTTNRRMATRVFVTAIGGNQNDALYAIVAEPAQPIGVESLIRINANGASTTLGSIQFPSNGDGQPFMASKIVISNSEMGVLSYRGYVAWYKLPLS